MLKTKLLLAAGASSNTKRYWRLRMTEVGATGYWWRVDELYMYTSSDGSGASIATAANAISSGDLSDYGETKEKAFQNILDSSAGVAEQVWGAGGSGPSQVGAWIGQSFVSPVEIKSMRFYPYWYTGDNMFAHYANKVAIDNSDNGVTWTQKKEFSVGRRYAQSDNYLLIL